MRLTAFLLLATGAVTAGARVPATSSAAANADAARAVPTAPAVSAPAAPAAPAMLGGSVAEPKAPVRLEVRLKPGQPYRFRIIDDTVMTATLPNGGQRRSATRSDATFEITVDRANPDGSYAIRAHPVRQSATVNDKDVEPSQASQADATATLTRDGRVSNIAGIPEDKSGKEDAAMNAQDFLEAIFDKDAGFPSRPLGLGDRWKDLVVSPLGEEKPKITVNNTLIALDVLDGKPVGRVLNVVAEPLQVPADEEGVTMSGALEGGGLITLDLETGLPIDARDTIRLKMTVSAPAPDGAKVNVDSEANIKVRIQALPPDGE